jgi:hypothetical protein
VGAEGRWSSLQGRLSCQRDEISLEYGFVLDIEVAYKKAQIDRIDRISQIFASYHLLSHAVSNLRFTNRNPRRDNTCNH